ncbi:unnamed protein product, partial [Symbiodinium sp. CCMP2592]
MVSKNMMARLHTSSHLRAFLPERKHSLPSSSGVEVLLYKFGNRELQGYGLLETMPRLDQVRAFLVEDMVVASTSAQCRHEPRLFLMQDKRPEARDEDIE